MLGRILVVGSTAVLLSSCALLQSLQRGDAREGYFPTRSISEQDPYMRKFYQLEREIAQLKASNHQLQARMQLDDAKEQASVKQDIGNPDAEEPMDFKTDEVLARVRQQADRAITAIDNAMQKLSQPAVRTVAVVQPVTQASVADISGELKRDQNGKVVGQTTYSAAREHRYNYSVVYIYPEPQPWNAMWDKLEQAREQDKWRGFNSDRSRYFIYVGAYFRQTDARQRQDDLMALVGEKPDVRERSQHQTLAAK